MPSLKELAADQPEIQQAIAAPKTDMANAPQASQDAPGISLKEVLGKVWDELERPGLQGSAELANTLFNGQAFVAYGEGQQSADPGHGLPQEAQKEEPAKDQGMER